ncbi:MAG: NAD(P)H-hydrate dehydratase [Gammaproteobacteria bacterium]|nr:NAD(P)H-hydrate dehydratase [Gammaproteobacteria bacterium]
MTEPSLPFEQLYTGSAAQQIDQLAIEKYGVAGYQLMCAAGEGAFALIQQRYSKPDLLLVVCGSGNNGGDGYIVAAAAQTAGWQVQVVALAAAKSASAKRASQRAIDAGVEISNAMPQAITEATLVIDAILGIGLNSAPRAAAARAIQQINDSAASVIALDVPSGLDADTGRALLPCIVADCTITFIVAKIGLVTGPGKSHSGQVLLVELPVPQEVLELVAPLAAVMAPHRLGLRRANSHKGDYGHVIIAGGETGMLGAVLLAASAALRCGSGKVTVLSTAEHVDKPALYRAEIMSAEFAAGNDELLAAADAIVLGPGLGLDSWGLSVFEALIGRSAPLLIDADALRHLAAHRHQPQGDWVLTPHPGEAAALLGCDTATVQADRVSAAREIAARYQAICVLKGAGTLIADPAGQLSVCLLGNPGMATAGMGDVLSGIIACLMGQGMGAMAAAETGVWLHAAAADAWVRENQQRALLASDVIDTLQLISVPD